MSAVLDRPGGPRIPTTAEVEAEQYDCDCPGFKTLDIARMCLRCLAAYTEGLPHVLKGKALQKEMRRVASCLQRALKDDPLLGNLPVHALLRSV